MILYFSGTGNSRYVAEAVSRTTGDELVSLNKLIKAGERGNFVSQRPLVIVAPVYAWRLPRLIKDFLQSASFSGNKDVYFLLTCGDSSGAAATYAARFCQGKGLNFRGFATIVMPENYIALFKAPSEQQSQQLIAAADQRLAQIAPLIAAGKPLPEEKSGLFGSLCSGLVNALFYRFIIKDKAFYATDKCNGCGRCVQLCPLNNIELADSKPRWQGNCTHCMACIGGCPQQAIEYGRGTHGKRRYYNTASPR